MDRLHTGEFCDKTDGGRRQKWTEGSEDEGFNEG